MIEKNHLAKFVCVLIFFIYFQSVFVEMAETVAVKVGIILDLNGKPGKMGLSCIKMSLSDFYESHSHYKTRLVFSIRDSHRDVVTAAAQALDLIKNEGVQAIIGPLTSMEANFVINLGDKAHVPIISFSATSPSLILLRSPYFFQIAKADSAQVEAISAIVQAFGWREAVPIYVDNYYGEGVIPFLTNALQQVNVRVPYLSAISPTATDDDITIELYKLMTMQTRVFVVHMTDVLGSRLFAIANHVGMMNQGYVWVLTDGMGNSLNSLDSSTIESMEGVLAVKPYIPRTKKLDDFKVRWKRNFLQDNPTLLDMNLNVFGLWAYDVTTALAMAVEKIGITNFDFHRKNNASKNLNDLERFGVSQTGKELREALSNNTKFMGLSGEFNIVDGQLKSLAFEIVNVIGNGERSVGYWTSENGLIRRLGSMKAITSSASKNNLGPIIWPGDTSSVPKGWEIPISGKKLRIGVPVKPKDGYTEFVGLTYDPSTNTTEVIGFCIDVFKAVLEALPYGLPYEFIPYGMPEDGESSGTYTDLAMQVYYENFDAVVGDLTITANRSNYVDFTMPYTESGVTMVVPVKDSRKKNAWTFLKPLTWDLWVTITCSFIFIGFIVWVLEHRINENFRGPPSHQISTSLWFSFSTVVFSHREKVVSNLGRPVVIIWLFVVLILVQSYTASLTSLLTVEQLRPTLTDVHQLIKNRINVGYLNGSFVYGILKNMGFQDSQLQVYNSTEHCNELFERGLMNGGIAAAFDEIPYLKLFLGTYCSKYTIVEPTFKTGGFGFVFPKGSPLVADISRAILNVTQGDKMKTIENAWFKNSSCPESDTSVSSNRLGLDSFWGLFLVAWVASILALVIFIITFLHQQRHIWLCNHATSFWKRVGMLLKVFDEKDMSCQTFEKSETSSTYGHGVSVVETSLSTDCPKSPSSRTESEFSFYRDQGTYYYGDLNSYAHSPQEIDINIVKNVPTERTTIEEVAHASD